ncbi:hypothetical protein DFP72DRAFT_823115 [Ephemerocybe angulata]|uniref:DDE Tnp4 domain-containing protein n=1 Tax=Ephemerocybe angulata TaxID=980116 RepID=A0A8H6HG75_9AGAR|nr:hypothetical protein DFP72DRAFT_823115 [Tulosesus angulatus]
MSITYYHDILEQILADRRLRFSEKVPKASQLPLVLGQFKENDPKRFQRNLRVSPATFDALVLAIEDHSVFHNRSYTAKQFPVEIQLAIALYRFGHFGNAASVEGVAQWSGTSAGLIVKSTVRVIVAFLSLHDKVIRWPSPSEKKAAKQWVEDESCPAWRDGFCMVDGTLIPLFEKPGHHGETYFDRKGNYSFSIQVSSFEDI